MADAMAGLDHSRRMLLDAEFPALLGVLLDVEKYAATRKGVV